MGVHTLNLAKHKIRAAQEHLKAALSALKDGRMGELIEGLQEAEHEIGDAKDLVK